MTTPLFTTRFNRDSTAAEVLAGVDLGGRRAVVTGGASGIGLETARALSDVGASVTLAVRDTAAGRRAADEVSATTRAQVGVARWIWPTRRPSPRSPRPGRTTGHPGRQRGGHGAPETAADRGRLGSAVRDQLLRALRPGHAAAHRAGCRRRGAGRVGELKRAPGLTGCAGRHPLRAAGVRPVDRDGQSKTANVLFAVGAASRWSDDGIAVNALMPGAIRTNLQRHITEEMLYRIREQVGAAGTVTWKTAQQGAATSVLLAAIARGGRRYGTVFRGLQRGWSTRRGDAHRGRRIRPRPRRRPCPVGDLGGGGPSIGDARQSAPLRSDVLAALLLTCLAA